MSNSRIYCQERLLLKNKFKRSENKTMKMENNKPRKIILPSEGETLAIATKSKTAALCYDRVLVPDLPPPLVDIDIPDSIKCCGESPFEIALIKLVEYRDILDGVKDKDVINRKNDEILGLIISIFGDSPTSSFDIEKDNTTALIEITKKMTGDPNVIASIVMRNMAKSFSQKYGVPVSVVCASKKEQAKLYKEGDREVIASILTNFEIADEEKLTWQQVMDFRKDKSSLQKYRRLLHWLDKEMIGKSQAFIEDDIAQKLEDYESTLKKHGLKTVLGTIEEVLDGKYLLGASGVVGSFSIAGYPGLGVLAGTGLIVGKMAVKLGNTWLDFDDAERGANSEISWVYEVKEQLKK